MVDAHGQLWSRQIGRLNEWKDIQMAHQLKAADEQECISHDEDGYLVATLELANGCFEQHRLHDLVCESFHGPKPTETSIAIVIDKGLHPTARNVGWLTQDSKYAHR
jgi:hypothetical protein